MVITPEAGAPSQYMAGFGWEPRLNNGTVGRELRAQCLIIFDTGVPNILVRVDALGFPPTVHHRIRDQVLAEGLVQTSSDFLLNASHTHSGPVLSERPIPYIVYNLDEDDVASVAAYTDIFVEQILNLVRQTSQQTPVPVFLSYAVGAVNISVNRIGLSWRPPDTPVLVARSTTSNEPVAILFGHACHPVARGIEPCWDSDFPGFAAELIEQQFSCPALFFQGALGDLNPDRGGGEDAVADVGMRLGNMVIQTILTGHFTPVDGPIWTAMEDLQVPFSVDPTNPVVASRLRTKYKNRLDTLGDTDGGLRASRRHAEVMLDQLDTQSLPPGVGMPMQCWRFGDTLTLLATGNELLSGYHVGLHNIYTAAPLWVMSCSNEVSCYCPADDVLWHQGPNPFYESGWFDDVEMAGVGSSMVAYGWQSPLKASPFGHPASPGSTEELIMSCCRRLLDLPPV